MLKNCNENRERGKNIKQILRCSQVYDHDLQVDLKINVFLVKQVVVDFVSQVNILPRDTWINMG